MRIRRSACAGPNDAADHPAAEDQAVLKADDARAAAKGARRRTGAHIGDIGGGDAGAQEGRHHGSQGLAV